MTRKNKLTIAPPYAVEKCVKRLGANLRTARLRRNLTIEDVAEKIGTGTRAVADAEKGKISTGIGVYTALFWALGLLEPLAQIGDPSHDTEGQILARMKERKRARRRGDLDNNF